MKRFLAHLLCTVLVFTLFVALEASAENSEKSPAVLAHVNAAKAVAYEPGNDLTTLFDSYAEHYDPHLRTALEYVIPDLFLAWHERLPASLRGWSQRPSRSYPFREAWSMIVWPKSVRVGWTSPYLSCTWNVTLASPDPGVGSLAEPPTSTGSISPCGGQRIWRERCRPTSGFVVSILTVSDFTSSHSPLLSSD